MIFLIKNLDRESNARFCKILQKYLPANLIHEFMAFHPATKLHIALYQTDINRY